MTTTAELPRDDVDAVLRRIDGVRGRRYGEVILIGTDASGHRVGSVYNTMATHEPDHGGDTWPAGVWEGIDPDVVAREHGALAAVKNGPRLWCLDWLEAMTGAERDFAGLRTGWTAWFDIAGQAGQGETPAYRAMTVRRDTRFGVDAGSTVHVLDDSDGDPWVLKSADLTALSGPDDLAGLGARLPLPSGWAFRTVVLDADLVLTPDDGSARILRDDLGNVYDRAGGPFSDHRP